ncbi:hypothetical protein ACFXJJ_29160 [Streptomyces sp. NPDC059233]
MKVYEGPVRLGDAGAGVGIHVNEVGDDSTFPTSEDEARVLVRADVSRHPGEGGYVDPNETKAPATIHTGTSPVPFGSSR